MAKKKQNSTAPPTGASRYLRPEDMTESRAWPSYQFSAFSWPEKNLLQRMLRELFAKFDDDLLGGALVIGSRQIEITGKWPDWKEHPIYEAEAIREEERQRQKAETANAQSANAASCEQPRSSGQNSAQPPSGDKDSAPQTEPVEAEAKPKSRSRRRKKKSGGSDLPDVPSPNLRTDQPLANSTLALGEVSLSEAGGQIIRAKNVAEYYGDDMAPHQPLLTELPPRGPNNLVIELETTLPQGDVLFGTTADHQDRLSSALARHSVEEITAFPSPGSSFASNSPIQKSYFLNTGIYESHISCDPLGQEPMFDRVGSFYRAMVLNVAGGQLLVSFYGQFKTGGYYKNLEIMLAVAQIIQKLWNHDVRLRESFAILTQKFSPDWPVEEQARIDQLLLDVRKTLEAADGDAEFMRWRSWQREVAKYR